ncbi:MAG: hypothetical protein ACYCV0_13045 [Desulfitobacteriaceae bacterium]
MLSTREEEVLGFIRDFESFSRNYLLEKGISQHEIANAYLELQWQFLHIILNKSNNSAQAH